MSTPKVNITETKEGFGLELNVPGFTKDQIRITMEENILKIHGEQEKVEAQEGESYLRREFSHTSFERGFHLPENVNGDGIKAEVTPWCAADPPAQSGALASLQRADRDQLSSIH
ncbi:MAG: Hsp20/alpha crystallin family protein [Flavobacteriales bacterium]|nr:Hsp20/alpha crystallin family protein [Flavobacteriales bacterium]